MRSYDEGDGGMCVAYTFDLDFRSEMSSGESCFEWAFLLTA